ncbi:MAG: 50S ribosomal protein L32 [Limnochordaceae bacterium]|uniref:Large ribosomal subunit protein bL32 n=1 Tax=Carboxydichorda subterranea TaxID=3109565 RepID=A0ABZ1C006_9FIRM|nr:50S ribosomal protein L32 [Limnochorda sp. L945t]MBE3598062.1 50S ribosomal protein L32 [Limnochordaceae bacterium]WRP18414.1 50S ribosomal protein L32 [Limnochorda sp. L945t]
MANPKRRFSKARTRTRRSMWRLVAPNLSECPRCHKLRVPHRVCPYCGTYDGRQYLPPVEQA